MSRTCGVRCITGMTTSTRKSRAAWSSVAVKLATLLMLRVPRSLRSTGEGCDGVSLCKGARRG
jgi:hypothetical protein